MLTALSIRNIILIDKLSLSFTPGLSVLTGETGAGKSILLDAFALALGARGDAGLVRKGAQEGDVSAAFTLSVDHPVQKKLSEHGLDDEGAVILRRVQLSDGRTKAFVNDRPVSVQLLKEIGSRLVEIHGQHDERALMDPASHRRLLDAYGGLTDDLNTVKKSWHSWREAVSALREHEAEMAHAAQEREYLENAVEELLALGPGETEEEDLAARRQLMMHAEKIAGDLEDAYKAISSDRGGQSVKISAALRKLERQQDATGEIIEPTVRALERVLIELDEARRIIGDALSKTSFQPSELETTEERLFALRAAARKYKVPVAALAGLTEKLQDALSMIQGGEEKLKALAEAAEEAENQFKTNADTLSKKRKIAAETLDAAVLAELPPLKLERAEFITMIDQMPYSQGGEDGIDRVTFWVRTNPGTEPGPIMKVASGGELSRFILALKVVLAARGSAPILIFDEVDTGVGGAVAAAIGERLSRLSNTVQVMTITHAPQVAALADQHLRIAKNATDGPEGDTMVTSVSILPNEDRLEEVARMLAGATVTDEARAAAKQLIGGGSE